MKLATPNLPLLYDVDRVSELEAQVAQLTRENNELRRLLHGGAEKIGSRVLLSASEGQHLTQGHHVDSRASSTAREYRPWSLAPFFGFFFNICSSLYFGVGISHTGSVSLSCGVPV
jgi:hypothetical protein